MSTHARIKSGGLSLIQIVFLLASCLFCSCRSNSRHEAPTFASICELRDKSGVFAGKIVRTSGWIYTDLERFGLQNDSRDCSVALDYSKMTTAEQSNSTTQQFEARIIAAKHGTFDTSGQVFAVVQGEFATYGEWKNERHPGTLLIERIICSADAPRAASTQAEALSQCDKAGGTPLESPRRF
jgi:hypothetical protein